MILLGNYSNPAKLWLAAAPAPAANGPMEEDDPRDLETRPLRVLVSWRGPHADGLIRIEWVESGGPPVQSPKHQGFGFLVITELVAQALQGTAKLDFAPDGVRWSLEIPASHALGTTNND